MARHLRIVGWALGVAVVSAAAGGCAYQGAGRLELRHDAAADHAALVANFDRVRVTGSASRRIVTAYQLPTRDDRPRVFWRGHRSDELFTQAELVVAVGESAGAGSAMLTLYQGDRPILRGPLVGPIASAESDGVTLLTGSGLRWRLDSDRAMVDTPTFASFDLRVP